MNKVEGLVATKIQSTKSGLRQLASGIKAVCDGQEATRDYFLQVAERWKHGNRFRSNDEYDAYCGQIRKANTRLAVWDTFIAPLAETLVSYAVVSPVIAVSTLVYKESDISMFPFYYGVIAPYPGGVLTKSLYMMARGALSRRNRSSSNSNDENSHCGRLTTTAVYGLAFLSNFVPLGHTFIHPLLGFVENPDLSFSTVNILTRNLKKDNPDNLYNFDPTIIGAYGSEYRRWI